MQLMTRPLTSGCLQSNNYTTTSSHECSTRSDALPHNVNLALWKRKDGLSDACKLCGERQTLFHVLNHCPTALDMRRCNVRHDAILEGIVQSIKPHPSDGDCLLADLPNSQVPSLLTLPTVTFAPTLFSGIMTTKPCVSHHLLRN